MSTNKKGSIEDVSKDMDTFLYAFGDDPLLLKPLIISHLIVMGWDRDKATAYAVLVEEYAKVRDDIVIIWSVKRIFLWKDLTRWIPGRRNKNMVGEEVTLS